MVNRRISDDSKECALRLWDLIWEVEDIRFALATIGGSSSSTGMVKSSCQSLLSSGALVFSLNFALDSPPYGPKVDVDEANSLALQMVVSVLNSAKGTEIPNVLKLLSQDVQDTLTVVSKLITSYRGGWEKFYSTGAVYIPTLTKYIYKGMGVYLDGETSVEACHLHGTRSLERGNGRLHCTSHVRLEDGVKTWYQSSTDYEPDTGVADSSYSLPQITRAGYGYAFAAVYDSKRGNYVSPRTSSKQYCPSLEVLYAEAFDARSSSLSWGSELGHWQSWSTLSGQSASLSLAGSTVVEAGASPWRLPGGGTPALHE
ncbi:hypothetical protein F5141DRAFT_1064542 [Pisolithus sp. B1]|nr:hypothetical protein F5141DRAFT_1064542 [Pisolithus sp. B1]